MGSIRQHGDVKCLGDRRRLWTAAAHQAVSGELVMVSGEVVMVSGGLVMVSGGLVMVSGGHGEWWSW